MKKDPLIFIRHILDSIADIEEFTKRIERKDQLLKKKVVYEAVIRKIEVIGEAVKNLPSSFKEKYPEIPWRGIAGMRDKLIHHYFNVDLDRVWIAIKHEIPLLKKQIENILKEEEERF
jgi:uncharacterized protein with HEPN domain